MTCLRSSTLLNLNQNVFHQRWFPNLHCCFLISKCDAKHSCFHVPLRRYKFSFKVLSEIPSFYAIRHYGSTSCALAEMKFFCLSFTYPGNSIVPISSANIFHVQKFKTDWWARLFSAMKKIHCSSNHISHQTRDSRDKKCDYLKKKQEFAPFEKQGCVSVQQGKSPAQASWRITGA